MNIKKIAEIKNIGKEKLILLGMAGILLIGASYFESIKEEKKPEEVTTGEYIENNYQEHTEKKVEKLIESIQGITDAEVVISYKSGSEKVLQEDSENSASERKDGNTNESSSSVKKSTVLFQEDGSEAPYVVKELYPEVGGIAVAAKGIAKNGKKEEIVNMLAALFDVPVHKISVIEVN